MHARTEAQGLAWGGYGAAKAKCRKSGFHRRLHKGRAEGENGSLRMPFQARAGNDVVFLSLSLPRSQGDHTQVQPDRSPHFARLFLSQSFLFRSFPRKRESRRSTMTRKTWIPAFAGMTRRWWIPAFEGMTENEGFPF
jgi:hypothetical protein